MTEQYPNELSLSSGMEPLIPEPYTYENMMENPIVKPIAEADKSLRDIDEIINKRLTDSLRDQKWVNSALEDVPAYSDSNFVSKLIKISQDTQEVIKLYGLEIKNLKDCIREINIIVTEKYGVRTDDRETFKVKTHTSVIPEGSERNYLNKLTNHTDSDIQKMSVILLKMFDETVENDENKKFRMVCGRLYNESKIKEEKDIVAKILRMTV